MENVAVPYRVGALSERTRSSVDTTECLGPSTGYRAAERSTRVVALCQGKAVTVTGSGPRVVPGWGAGYENVVPSGSGGDGTNADRHEATGAPGAGSIDCHAAQGESLCAQMQEVKVF